MYAVPENYFDVVKTEYYVQNSVQDNLTGISELSNGDLNPIEMLYSNEDLNEYPETIENVNRLNAYNITTMYQSSSIYMP